MKRRILPLALLMSGYVSYAQVGIGTREPDQSAILELNASNKGLLIPQVALRNLIDTSVIDGGNPKVGLLIYNTTMDGSKILPGYYYWGVNYASKDKNLQWIGMGDDISSAFKNQNKSLSVDEEFLILEDLNGHTVSIPLSSLQIATKIEQDKSRKGVYVYTNEKKATFEIKILEEIIHNFGDIITDDSVINHIVKALKGKYGNVIYEGDVFYTINPDTGKKTPIDWSSLDTTNEKFAIEKIEGVESLVITDSKGDKVSMAVAEIAKNETFITELTENKEFIDKITNNNDFVTNVINKLKGKYGNVIYEGDAFYTVNPETGKTTPIDWSSLDTTNEKFGIEKIEGVESLVITDSKGDKVSMAVAEIAKNETFITELTENKEFIDKITNNNDFVTNVINKLKGKYGNVIYEGDAFYTVNPETGETTPIDWSSLDTTNEKFGIEKIEGVESLVITDSKGDKVSMAVAEIAKNETFITELTENKEFIDKITNNNDFVTNIINKLKGKYGNVIYEGDVFYTVNPETGETTPIDWSSLDTTNEKFAIEKVEGVESLVITDSKGDKVSMAVAEIAKNETFITELTENKEFIDKITNNNEFVSNIINKLKGKYGNVIYEGDAFYTVNPETGETTLIDWSSLDTTNEKFAIEKIEGVESLVITDSKGDKVSMAVAEIAKNETFITELTENKEFIDKITNNNEFVSNIINKLKGKYGNVIYEGDAFYTVNPETGEKTPIDWSSLDTTNEKFAIEKIEGVESLVITDSKGDKVSMAVAEIAKNETFITELTENKEFIDKITNNNDFVSNIINKLKGKYGNVIYEGDAFYTVNPETGEKTPIDWSSLDTTNEKFAIEKVEGVESLVITDSKGDKVSMAVAEIANNATFITELTENKEFIDKITNNNEFVSNIINKLKGKYGNVIYEGDAFYTVNPETGEKTLIDWSSLDTTNEKFAIEKVEGVESLVITDSKGDKVSMAVAEIANNATFITELVNNDSFITELTNKEEFITNIINKLNKTFGNVVYNTTENKFYYLDDQGKPQEIDWSALNTINVSFVLEEIEGKDYLVVNDSDKGRVKLEVAEIANNATFITELVNNDSFITELTNKEEFITNIINKLNKTFGNVVYNTTENKFYYLDDQGKPQEIDWSALNTINVSFVLEEIEGKDYLVVNDSAKGRVKLEVAEIANNATFITELVNNDSFITELTNKEEFITNIINKLNKTFGNVVYNTTENKFYYLDDQGKPQEIDWSVLNTINVSFVLEEIEGKDYLVVNDSDKGRVKLEVAEIANNATFITELVNNDSFITELTNKEEFITKIKGIQAYSSISNQSADENAKKVQYAKKFNDGKEGSADVLLTETLTSIERGKEKGKDASSNFIAYNYFDETGELATAQITVTSDVINSFEQIIKDESVKKELNKFITNSTGNVSVSKDAITGNITITYQDGDTTASLDLTKEVQRVQNYSEVSSIEAVEGASGKGIKINTKEEGVTPTNFVETLTTTTRYKGDGSEQNVAVAPTAGMIYYSYKDESGSTRYITVSEDISNDFSKIINYGDNKEFIENIIKDYSGDVKVINNNGDIVFEITNTDGTTNTVNLTQLIKDNTAIASVVEQSADENAKKVQYAKKFNDGKEGSADVLLTETLTSIERGKEKGKDAGSNFIAYNYFDETGELATAQITVTSDVINSFEQIIKDESVKKELNKFITNSTGNVSVSKDAITGNITITYQDGDTTASLDLTKEIHRVQNYSEVSSIEAVEGTSGKGIKINTKEEGVTPTNFVETLTTTTRYKGDGSEQNVAVAPTAGMIYYSYKDESGSTRYITVSEDVSNDFSKIINYGDNKEFIENIIKDYSGDVKVINNNGDIVFEITNTDGTTNTVNLTQLIKDNTAIASVVEQSADENAKKVQYAKKFNDGKEGSADVLLTETLTSIERGKEKGKDAGSNFIAYNYFDETGELATAQITVTSDVINSFEQIIKDESVKKELNKFITNSTGNVSVSKDAITGNITITYQDGDTTASLDLTKEVQRVQNYSEVSIIEAVEGASGKGIKINTKEEGVTPTNFVETLTTTTRYKGDGSEQNVAVAPTAGMIYYSYKDESGSTRYITVSEDVSNDFSKIINYGDNKEFIENIIKDYSGDVKVINNNGDIVFEITNTAGTTSVNLTQLIKDNAKHPWLIQGTQNLATTDAQNIAHTGTVAIGSNSLLNNSKSTNTKLSVNGDVVINGKFFSANSVYADYVFEKYFTGASDLNLTYEFKSLDYVKAFVEKYNHLPGVTKISELEKTADGNYVIDFTELSIQQLEKIEELYLHTIEQQEQIKVLEEKLNRLEARFNDFEKDILNK